MLLLDIWFKVFSDVIRSSSQVGFSELTQYSINGCISNHLRRVQKTKGDKEQGLLSVAQAIFPELSFRGPLLSWGITISQNIHPSLCLRQMALLTPLGPFPQFWEFTLLPLPVWLLTDRRFQANHFVEGPHSDLFDVPLWLNSGYAFLRGDQFHFLQGNIKCIWN